MRGRATNITFNTANWDSFGGFSEAPGPISLKCGAEVAAAVPCLGGTGVVGGPALVAGAREGGAGATVAEDWTGKVDIDAWKAAVN